MKFLVSALIFLSFNSALTAQDALALTNINIIPMNREVLLKDQTVVIEKGKIKHIAASASYRLPDHISTIDGSGRYLMPGLFDMHAHFFYEQDLNKSGIEADLNRMLANGLTTVRIMNGDPLYLNAKSTVARGQAAGPELFVVSPQLVGQWPFSGAFFGEIVQNPIDASNAVQRFKREGYDAIKLTFYLKPEVYTAIINSAKSLNLKVTGHVGSQIGLTKALEMKQQIEHLDEFLEMLIPESERTKQGISGPGIWLPENWDLLDKMNESRIPALVRAVKNANIFVTPTNYFLHSSFGIRQSASDIYSMPGFDFIPDTLKKERFEIKNLYWSQAPSAERREKFVDLRRKITLNLYQEDVPLMAGSDSPEWFLVPGFSIHNELEEFVESGLKPFAALQTATVNPAKYLGVLHKTGTVEVNKEADLIILNENPMEKIGNTRTILAVINNGVLYDTEAIRNLLKGSHPAVME